MKLKLRIGKIKKETTRRDVLGEVQLFTDQLMKMVNLKQDLLVSSR